MKWFRFGPYLAEVRIGTITRSHNDEVTVKTLDAAAKASYARALEGPDIATATHPDVFPRWSHTNGYALSVRMDGRRERMARYDERHWPGLPGGTTRAERRPCSYRAYVPDPLVGRRLVLAADQAADIADIERRIAELDAASGPPKVCLEAIARLSLRAEAVASSFIEGLQINVRRLAKAAVAEQTGLPAHDETARAVLGNVKAMHSAIERAANDRLGVDDILHIHTELLAGTRDARFAGVVRTEQNWVGGRGLSPCGADYVPPPPECVPDLLADLCDYLNSEEHPALVQAALAHAQFETIHPFADGNGRTGRALIHLILRRRGLASNFTVPISLILAAHADAYIASLVAYRYEGDGDSASAQEAMQACIDRFIADAAGACAKVQHFRDVAERLEADWRRRLGQVKKGSSTDVLLGYLPSVPVLTVATAAALIGRSPQRVNDAVNQLTTLGVLKQTTIGRRNRAYEVPDLIQALTGFERALASPAGDTAQAPPTRPVPARPQRRQRP